MIEQRHELLPHNGAGPVLNGCSQDGVSIVRVPGRTINHLSQHQDLVCAREHYWSNAENTAVNCKPEHYRDNVAWFHSAVRSHAM